MMCSGCGKSLPEGTAVCPVCGKKLSSSPAPAPAARPAPQKAPAPKPVKQAAKVSSSGGRCPNCGKGLVNGSCPLCGLTAGVQSPGKQRSASPTPVPVVTPVVNSNPSNSTVNNTQAAPSSSFAPPPPVQPAYNAPPQNSVRTKAPRQPASGAPVSTSGAAAAVTAANTKVLIGIGAAILAVVLFILIFIVGIFKSTEDKILGTWEVVEYNDENGDPVKYKGVGMVYTFEEGKSVTVTYDGESKDRIYVLDGTSLSIYRNEEAKTAERVGAGGGYYNYKIESISGSEMKLKEIRTGYTLIFKKI